MTLSVRTAALGAALALLAPFASARLASAAPAFAPPFAPPFAPVVGDDAQAEAELWKAARIHEPPAETYEVLRVVDGDTLHVRRAGKLEKLRLLSVDTEERILPDLQSSATKPQTAFGEACALWARKLFDGLADERGPARVGLLFPGGREERDVYGRLLCQVVLPDGTDYDLLLVLLGKSPYFNKYGNSELCHEAFVAAQAQARAAERGIWSPHANEPTTPDAPAAKRPYDELLPWWEARARAIDAFRAARAADPAHVLAADDPAALLAAQGKPVEVRVFGSIARFYDESNGDRTVLLRSGDEQTSLRVRIPHRALAAHEALELEATREELRQNYLWVRGRIVKGARGPELVSDDPSRWSLAGPQPEELGEPEAAGATPAAQGGGR